jgi:hypothetical protein
MANQALTVIKILKGAPCDDTYSDVIKFGSAGAQAAYFSGLAKYSFSNCSYQRVNNSVASPRSPLTCRIPTVADSVYDCNYVMFQNTFWGNKWFYAFIRRINYINPDTTEIEYEIDSYQTYQFDYTVKPSLVEREHPVDDSYFGNQQKEPLSVPYVMENFASTTHIERLGNQQTNVQLWVKTDQTGLSNVGEVRDGVYQGICANIYGDRTPDQAKQDLSDFAATNHIDYVVGVQTTPFQCTTSIPDREVSVPMVKSLHGYIPKYKKCFNYPFNFIKVTDLCGNEIEYYYEKFSLQQYSSKTGEITTVFKEPKFKMRWFTGYPPAVQFVPIGYVNVFEGVEEWDSSFVVSGFPETTINGGGWQSIITRGVLDSIKLLVTVLMAGGTQSFTQAGGGTATVASSSGLGLEGHISTAASHMAMQDTAKKGVGDIAKNLGTMLDPLTTCRDKNASFNHCFNFKANKNEIDIKQMTAPIEYIVKIDQFFDMYGYATNSVKVPNEDSRESWNYVKTDNVIINGSMPVQDMATIKAMYNRGVRFWHTTDVGNYSLSNRDMKEVVTDDVS